MTDVVAPKAEPPEERLLERKDDREPVHRGRESPRPARSPGPELGRDVVQHLGAGGSGRLGHPDVKAGVVDEDDEVVASGPKVVPHGAQEPPMRSQLCHDLHHAEGREPLHAIAEGGARALHERPTERLDLRVGMSGEEGADHAGAVEITRGLAGGDEDTRRGPCDHPAAGAASGVVRTASATRSASASAARPSSPVTTTARSPRTA